MAGHSGGRGGPRSQFLGAASYPWNQGKWQFLWRFKWNSLIENIIQNIFETQCMQLCWAKYGKGWFPFKICFRLVVVPIVKYFASTWPKCVGGWDCNICSSWSIPSGHNPLCQKKTNVQGKSKAKYKSIPDNRASGSDWKLLYQLQSTFVSNDRDPRWPTFACIFSPLEPSSSTLAANFNSKQSHWNLPVLL